MYMGGVLSVPSIGHGLAVVADGAPRSNRVEHSAPGRLGGSLLEPQPC